MPQEIELKLAIEAQDVPKLRKSSILRELSLKHTGPRSLVSVYYDTPSRSLWRRGIMLRVRKIGHARVQCVKLNAAATSLFQRTEIEGPVRGDRPDLTQIADPDVRRLIRKYCAGENLTRVFATNVRRETWLVPLGRSRIECALDRGVIAFERKRAPISEIELELKSGQAARIYQLARRLNALLPLRIETKSKGARGYDLVEHATLAAPSPGPILVNPAMSLRECFAAIAQPCAAHVLASANFAGKSKDPEGIHQLRIGIRRMRFAFAIFHSATPESHRPRLAVRLRTLEFQLSAARDWDVLVEETIVGMPGNLRRQRSTQHLLRLAQTKRAEGDNSAHACLRNPQYTDILLQLAAWVDRFGSNAPPVQAEKWRPDIRAPEFAAETMRVYHQKAQKLGRRIRKLDPLELHKLRIRIKRLRYGTEFFGGFWPGQRTARYLAALGDLQDGIGAFHDTTVADGLLAHFKATEGADAEFSTAPISRWLTERQQHLRKEAIDLWHEFASQKPFWKDG